MRCALEYLDSNDGDMPVMCIVYLGLYVANLICMYTMKRVHFGIPEAAQSMEYLLVSWMYGCVGPLYYMDRETDDEDMFDDL
jgi:hypothetical protein